MELLSSAFGVRRIGEGFLSSFPFLFSSPFPIEGGVEFVEEEGELIYFPLSSLLASTIVMIWRGLPSRRFRICSFFPFLFSFSAVTQEVVVMMMLPSSLSPLFFSGRQNCRTRVGRPESAKPTAPGFRLPPPLSSRLDRQPSQRNAVHVPPTDAPTTSVVEHVAEEVPFFFPSSLSVGIPAFLEVADRARFTAPPFFSFPPFPGLPPGNFSWAGLLCRRLAYSFFSSPPLSPESLQGSSIALLSSAISPFDQQMLDGLISLSFLPFFPSPLMRFWKLQATCRRGRSDWPLFYLLFLFFFFLPVSRQVENLRCLINEIAPSAPPTGLCLVSIQRQHVVSFFLFPSSSSFS